jgi:hypothetical protein
VDGQFKQALSRFSNKEEIDAPNSQRSLFQKGFNMLYCNAGPIASACYLSRDSTQSALKALVQAIVDLTRLGYDINLDFEFAQLYIRNKNLKSGFCPNFISLMNQPNFENKVILNFDWKLCKSKTKTSSFWRPKTTFKKTGMNST